MRDDIPILPRFFEFPVDGKGCDNRLGSVAISAWVIRPKKKLHVWMNRPEVAIWTSIIAGILATVALLTC